MKSPGLLFLLSSSMALLGGGILIGRFVLPSRTAEDQNQRPEKSSPGATLSSPLAGVPAESGAQEPFKGSLADLLREAHAAGDLSGAQLRLTLLLASTGPEDIERLARGIKYWRNSPDWEETAIRFTLINRWAETAPLAALEWTDALPGDQPMGPRSQILSRWAQTDAAGALKYARGLRKPNEREQAVSLIAGVIATTDPQEALRLLQSMGGSSNAWRFGNVFATWAKDDPLAAHAAALRLPNQRERQSALGSVFSTWARSDPEAAKDAALSITNASTRNQVLQNVLGAWAETAPDEAFAVVETLPAGQSRTNAINSILQHWATSDPTRAMAVFDTLSRKEKENCYWTIAQNLSKEDPMAALTWAQTLPGSNMSGNALSNILSQWASDDGPAAAAALAALPAHLRSNKFQNVASQWAATDRDAALRWARSLERPLDRSQALAGCLGDSDLSDPTEINALLAEMPKGQARTNLLSNIVSNQGANDPEATLAWLRSLPDNDRSAAIRNGSLQEIAESNPQSVAAMLLESPEAATNQWLWTSTATSFAATDPQAALAWAESIAVPGDRKAAVQAAVQAWAQTDPDSALTYARSLADKDARASTVSAVFENWASEDPIGLLNWAETAQGEERLTALLKSSVQLSSGDPAIGADVLSQLLASQNNPSKPSDDLRNAVSQIANSWVRQDVTAACAWAATLPVGSMQNKAIESIASGWVQQDPMAASAWIGGLPAGDARDGAVGSLVNSISRSDPESAFLWADSIGDSSKRDRNIRSAVQYWRNLDPAAARAAVNQAAISDALREDLLSQFDDNR